ncbi:MAG TPA: glycosyltransferase family 39 protein, partial [Candidatus Sulfopaludibacter sp.]|nr:glycosyltransferase family 39 protein [Candidatus Sulfopaludibacter sp.]
MTRGLLWLLLAAAIVRLWLMPLRSSFWVDEMATAFVVERGAADPSFAVAPQVPDSLYYWLPRASVGLLGRSEAAFRLPSVLAMGFALWLAALLAARLIHPEARWFAVFACLALHGTDYYAVDARPYGLGMAVAAAAMWFLVRWLDGARWRDGLAFAACAALLWRVHLLYWPMYLVFGGYTAARAKEKVGWKRAAVVLGLAALALIPVAWRAAALARETAAHVFAPLPDWREFLHLSRWNLVAICGVGAWLLRRRGSAGSRRDGALPILAWWLAPPVCLFAFSRITGESVFVTRYVSLLLPGAALSATLAAACFLPARYWRVGAAALGLGALVAFGQWGRLWPEHEHSGWREAAAAVNQAAGRETPVICPSPFVEARPPAWTPDYRLPGFLYAHLSVYPVAGQVEL